MSKFQRCHWRFEVGHPDYQSDSVVGDQDSIDHTGAAEALHELLGGGDVEVTVLMAILAQASASRHARPEKDQEKGVSKNNIRNSIKKGGS